jgi:FkbM family methyltransferase
MAQAAWIATIRHAPPWLRRPLQRYHRNGQQDQWRRPFDIALRGVRFRCNTADNTPEHKLVFQGRRMDHWHLAQIRPFLRADDSTFVDIGANFGFFSLNACRMLRGGGRVLAIEPNPQMANRLRENIRLNGFRSIAVKQAAIGAVRGRAGRADTGADHGSVGFGALDGTGQPFAGDGVEMLPLHDLLAEQGINRIDVLKIDIEGYEPEALLPFFKTAPASLYPRMILMEQSHAAKWGTDLLDQLIARGYSITAKGRMDIVLQRRT